MLFLLWIPFLAVAVAKPTKHQAFIICLFIAYALHQIVKTMAAVEATRRLNDERRSGALELLLVTPLPERDILRGLALSFRKKFAPLRGLIVFTNLTMAFVVMKWAAHLQMTGPVVE